MNSKILLLSIAVISVGLFAMPSTLSLFAGQHTFDKAGNTTICAKCHSDVVTEINAGAFHKTLLTNSSAGTSGNDCRGCHTTSTVNASLIPTGNSSVGNGTGTWNVGLAKNGTFLMANGTSYYAGSVHAAITVECKSCHYAVTFTNDAHKSFADNTTTETWLKGANEACVGCHTKARVEMTWVRRGGYNYTYNFGTGVGSVEANLTSSTSNVTTTNSTG